jgi:hypothetical protein
MITLHDIARTPTLLAAKLRKLERQGRYDEALKDCLKVVGGSMEQTNVSKRSLCFATAL